MDFAKHIDKSDILKVGYVWNSIPSQLSRENRKFLYQTEKKRARAREYEYAIEWLGRAGLVYKIHRTSAAKLPLKAYQDLSAFKLYMLDTGLLRRHALLSPSAFTEGNRLFTEFKGALSENNILQSLIINLRVNLHIGHREIKLKLILCFNIIMTLFLADYTQKFIEQAKSIQA